jgi:CheY-like chemotaxis protein
VRRLQEFTRIRRDQPFVALDLNEVVRDAVAMTQSHWRDEARRRGIGIEVRTVLAPLPSVAGDAAELREAMTNLILNAVDAMPAGGVLTLATTPVPDGAQISVDDTGVGMAEAVRTRVFDPFFTTKGPRGTGLGLAMTYGIVARHGGRIEVETAEGRGSTFRLVFPVPAVVPVADPPAPIAAPAPAAALSCLVVDDEEAVGALMADVLRAGGHRVVLCQGGAAGVARVRDEPFDVVFTDLAMPDVSGWDVAQAVRAVAPDTPVVLVTGFGVELSTEECRASGIDEVLVKPLSVGQILAAAARAAQRRRPT